MNRLGVLIKGELVRLNKYGVFSISILVAVLWAIVLFLIDSDYLGTFLPFILLLDATMMSIMYIGAEMHFEKTESTISTMLVTPVTNNELVASKVIANTIHNLVSSLLIVGVFYGAGELEYIVDPGIKILPLIMAIVVTTSTFTIAGLILSYYQKDFTEMLVNMFILVFLFMVPSILMMFGVIEGEFWENLMLINPIQAAQNIIIMGGFESAEALGYEYYVSLGYLFFGGILLYTLLAIPRFQDYAIRQSGV